TVHVEHGAFEAEKKQKSVVEEGNGTESVEQLKAEKVEDVKHADAEVKNVAQLSDEEKCVPPAVKNKEDLYKTYDCEFLLDDEDTIEKYNENSQKNPISSIEEMFDHYTVGMNPLQKNYGNEERTFTDVCRM
ncbi:hypothetical protein D917_03767, partial [Trichinella nativa]